MKPAMWSCYLFDLSPEDAVRKFAAGGWTELELGDEHAFVLLARGEAGIREAGPLLQALHLHDNDGSGDQHLMPYGAGKIDWKDVFSALKEVGYRGLYNWEIPGERRGPVEVRLAKLDYLRTAWPAISSGQMYDYDDMKAVWRKLH